MRSKHLMFLFVFLLIALVLRVLITPYPTNLRLKSEHFITGPANDWGGIPLDPKEVAREKAECAKSVKDLQEKISSMQAEFSKSTRDAARLKEIQDATTRKEYEDRIKIAEDGRNDAMKKTQSAEEKYNDAMLAKTKCETDATQQGPALTTCRNDLDTERKLRDECVQSLKLQKALRVIQESTASF